MSVKWPKTQKLFFSRIDENPELPSISGSTNISNQGSGRSRVEADGAKNPRKSSTNAHCFIQYENSYIRPEDAEFEGIAKNNKEGQYRPH